MAAISATVYGMVQGVGFRFFVRRAAREMNIGGYVRNLPDGKAVEVAATADKSKLDELIRLLKTGPGMARVDRVDVEWLQYENRFTGFEIRF